MIRWITEKFIGSGLMLFTGIALAADAANGDAAQFDAKKLAQVMRVDQIMVLGFLGTIFPRQTDHKLPEYQDFAKCMFSVNLSEIIDIYAVALRKKISDRDIRIALQFYKSPVGKKLDTNSWNETLQGFVLPTGEDADISNSEKIIIERFATSRVGKALWSDRVYETQAVFKNANNVMLKVMRPCLEPLVEIQKRKEAKADEAAQKQE